MITVRNTQRKIALNKQEIFSTAQKILDIIGYQDYELNILITNNRTIRVYNKKFRSIDKPTDILSFSYYPDYNDNEKILGDLILSAEYILREATKAQIPFKERLVVLLVHGVCHLLGYDHVHDKDYRRMRAKEQMI